MTIKTPDGGTIDPGTGAITPASGGSIGITTQNGQITITPPTNGSVTRSSDGSIAIPGGSIVQTSDGKRITIPPEGGTLRPDGSLTYPVTVTFDSRGGSTVASQTVDVGTAVPRPADPTLSGYFLQGWYTAADGGTQWNFADPVLEDMILYARWAQSSGGTTTYPPAIAESEHGSVTVSPSRPKRGDTVTLTPEPDEGYEVDEVMVTDRNGDEIELTDHGDGTWSFTQPSGQVTISVTFVCDGRTEHCPAHGYTDVDTGAWYHLAVDYAVENGLMNGVSETGFAPNAATSRSMLVTILYRLEGEPAAEGTMDFTDVAEGEWYTDAVRWAAGADIVGGYGNGLFGSDDAVTREQLAVILYRYAVYKGYDVSIGEDTNILSYADFADLSEYAIPAMQWACGAGIVNGTSESTLTPQGEATRAQVAAMLMRFCESIVQ